VSYCLQRLRYGHDPAEGTEFVQVAEHLDADGLVRAADPTVLPEMAIAVNAFRRVVSESDSCYGRS
jgi:hypothetical protein